MRAASSALTVPSASMMPSTVVGTKPPSPASFTKSSSAGIGSVSASMRGCKGSVRICTFCSTGAAKPVKNEPRSSFTLWNSTCGTPPKPAFESPAITAALLNAQATFKSAPMDGSTAVPRSLARFRFTLALPLSVASNRFAPGVNSPMRSLLSAPCVPGSSKSRAKLPEKEVGATPSPSTADSSVTRKRNSERWADTSSPGTVVVKPALKVEALFAVSR